MRRGLPIVAVMIALGLSGCQEVPAKPPVAQNGWLVYSGNFTRVNAVCGTEPIRLTGNHTTVTLTGACTNVQLAGNHNDVDVAMAPGGRFEITGNNNDVWWHPSAPGAPPEMLDHGKSDAFHAGHP